ncbi:hypothetical protein QYE76_051396 [Lolium multiflorum]|uniref:Uncharacterized protein n=1 Tax=Lolium multiflorum TaxID=4521 RepID=A0AAD8SRT5_LOLMU|nr:hypothetical protein QYE76_051396 [Lolium multiflorum]
MAAAAWDVLSKAANLAQMSGLHAAMLVAVLTTLLRVHQSNKRECERLERCHGRLHQLLQWPTAGALLCSELGGPVVMALVDAAGLVDSYKRSTLWRRVRSGGRMATQLRDMQDVLNSYCGLLLFVNAHLLLQEQASRCHHHPVPASSDTSTATIHEANDTSPSPSCQEGTADRDT